MAWLGVSNGTTYLVPDLPGPLEAFKRIGWIQQRAPSHIKEPPETILYKPPRKRRKKASA